MFVPQPQNDVPRAALLFEQIAAVGRLDDTRPSARERLEETLGCDLAQRLIAALTGDKPMNTARRVA